MEWLATAIFLIVLIAIGFNFLSSSARLAMRILRWIVGPKEWWPGALVQGSFRPRVRTILLLSLIIVILCALTFPLFVSFITGSGWAGWCALGILFGLPFGTKRLWRYVRVREDLAVQQRRDERAQNFRHAISSVGVSPSFCLYLRPFKSTRSIGLRLLDSTMTTEWPPGSEHISTSHDQTSADLEKLLAMAVDSYAPLVALGRPGEQVGAGRILTTEEGWKADFLQLADAARVIFLMPSPQPGTAWELGTVLADPKFLFKTVFIIPPIAGNDNIHRDALRVFELRTGADLQSLAGRSHPGVQISNSGLVFRWDQTARCFTFSAPLINYVGPSPVRFLLDIWLSRETVFISGSRLKGVLRTSYREIGDGGDRGFVNPGEVPGTPKDGLGHPA